MATTERISTREAHTLSLGTVPVSGRDRAGGRLSVNPDGGCGTLHGEAACLDSGVAS